MLKLELGSCYNCGVNERQDVYLQLNSWLPCMPKPRLVHTETFVCSTLAPSAMHPSAPGTLRSATPMCKQTQNPCLPLWRQDGRQALGLGRSVACCMSRLRAYACGPSWCDKDTDVPHIKMGNRGLVMTHSLHLRHSVMLAGLALLQPLVSCSDTLQVCSCWYQPLKSHMLT